MFLHYLVLRSNERRKGWPLLTIENGASGDLRSTNEGGHSLVGSLGCRAGTRDFYSALAALVSPVKIFFPQRIYFQFVCPIAKQSNLGRQSCRAACL